MLPHPLERYRLYVDETGIQALKNVHNDPFLCLFGVIMKRSHHDGPAQERLDKIKADLFGHSDENPIILHRREIVRGSPPFDLLHDHDELRDEFEARWFSLIRESTFVCIATAIDKSAHLDKYKVWQHDPYHYCLECLLERYVLWLNRNGFHGDVIIEGRGRRPNMRLERSYQGLYYNGNSFVSETVVRNRLTSRSLKFSDKSDNVAGIQIADSLAHPTLAYLRSKLQGKQARPTYGARLVDVLLQYKFVRNPTSNAIPGWGTKTLP